MARAPRSSVTVNANKAVKAVEQVESRINETGLARYLTSLAAPHFARRAKSRFQESGDEASEGWKPLSPSTVAERRRLGFTPGTGRGQIQVRSGQLRRWFTDPRNITIVPDATGGVALRWPGGEPEGRLRMKLLQAGGRGRGPARFVVAYDASDVAYLVGSLQGYIADGKVRRRGD